MTVAALIVAAGRGSRAGGEVPKQYRKLGGKPVLARTLDAFLTHPGIDLVQPVMHLDDDMLFQNVVRDLPHHLESKLEAPVGGGETRQASVYRGLRAISRATEAQPAVVLIHDAARPFASAKLIDAAIAAAAHHRAAVPGLMPTDTIKIVNAASEVVETPNRSSLRAIQTPQAFDFAAILSAHGKAATAGLDAFSDDGALAEWAGLPVHVFDGEAANVKLTHEADFTEAERRLADAGAASVMRVGTGFDVHALTDGDHVWLGGLRLASDRGVLAHSDGDVVLHALTDAVLGAIADGDIGVHFPPSDPQWRGASSDRFLAFAAHRVRQQGGVIDNLDATVLCEAPRIGPHRNAMRERIATVAGVPIGSVSIKATTTERLGFVGRGEGIAAQAIATVRLPGRS